MRVPLLSPASLPPYKPAGGMRVHPLDSILVNLRQTFFVHTTLPCLSVGLLIKFYAVTGLFCLRLTSWSCIMLRAITHLFITHPQI